MLKKKKWGRHARISKRQSETFVETGAVRFVCPQQEEPFSQACASIELIWREDEKRRTKVTSGWERRKVSSGGVHEKKENNKSKKREEISLNSPWWRPFWPNYKENSPTLPFFWLPRPWAFFHICWQFTKETNLLGRVFPGRNTLLFG